MQLVAAACKPPQCGRPRPVRMLGRWAHLSAPRESRAFWWCLALGRVRRRLHMPCGWCTVWC